MKRKLIAILLVVLLVFSFAACKKEETPPAGNNDTPVVDNQDDTANTEGLPELRDVTEKVEFAEFTFKVNGQEVTNADLEGLAIYKIDATGTNKKGETTTHTYCGYVVKDVLAKLGVTEFTSVKAIANDGYEVTYDAEMAGHTHTLIAIEKDKELGDEGTVWFAPCHTGSTGDITKLVVEIVAE